MLVALVLTTSCIKEDYDDCDNVTIYFQYFADGETDVLSQYMSKIDLYVFDEGGHILGVGHYNQDELSKHAAKPSFKLPAGKTYHVIALGNAYDNTEVENLQATNFEEIYIQSPQLRRPEPITNHDKNYLGMRTIYVPGGEGIMYRDTVTLYSAHINVSVEIYGLPAPSTRAGEIPYELSFEDANAQTSFTNYINQEEKCTVYPDLIYDASKKCYRTDDFALFRMDVDGELSIDCCAHSLVLKDTNTGQELVRGSVYNYLDRNRGGIDVTKQEALLPVEIQFNGINADIVLPDWVIVGGEPDWN